MDGQSPSCVSTLQTALRMAVTRKVLQALEIRFSSKIQARVLYMPNYIMSHLKLPYMGGPGIGKGQSQIPCSKAVSAKPHSDSSEAPASTTQSGSSSLSSLHSLILSLHSTSPAANRMSGSSAHRLLAWPQRQSGGRVGCGEGDPCESYHVCLAAREAYGDDLPTSFQ